MPKRMSCSFDCFKNLVCIAHKPFEIILVSLGLFEHTALAEDLTSLGVQSVHEMIRKERYSQVHEK